MKLRPSRLFKCFHVLRRFREAFASLFATVFTSLLGETSYFEAPYLKSPSENIIQPVDGRLRMMLLNQYDFVVGVIYPFTKYA